MPPRTIHVVAALAAAAAAVWAADVRLTWSLASLAAGAMLGRWTASAYTRTLEQRIDPEGGLVLYVEDAFLHGLLLPLALLALSPIAFGSALFVIARSPVAQQSVELSACAVAGAWLAHDATLFKRLRQLACQRPLRIQRFYGRSAVGPQAMIGRKAVVIEANGLAGVVRVGPELWKAHALDGRPLTVGATVTVRRIEGLVIGVEASALS